MGRGILDAVLSLRERVRVRALRATGLVLAGLSLAACSTGAYPLDIFSEMHYQQSFRVQEPPRPPAPAGSVPIQGGEPRYSFFETLKLRNTVPATADNLARAKKLFQVNCQVCHGPRGDGKGPMAIYFQNAGERTPADFTSDAVQGKSDGELFWSISTGLGQMPPFQSLLSAQDRWTLLLFVRNPG
ncbi:MAG: cytochrome c [Chloroflexi bacterium]|nr:cytochrome c [Chloroflexota bacterium]